MIISSKLSFSFFHGLCNLILIAEILISDVIMIYYATGPTQYLRVIFARRRSLLLTVGQNSDTLMGLNTGMNWLLQPDRWKVFSTTLLTCEGFDFSILPTSPIQINDCSTRLYTTNAHFHSNFVFLLENHYLH